MGFKKIPRKPVGADLSAFAGCSALPLNLLGKVHIHVTVPHQQQGPALSSLRFAQGQALSEAKDLAADRDRPLASRRRDTG
jgi:hypothetical protein